MSHTRIRRLWGRNNITVQGEIKSFRAGQAKEITDDNHAKSVAILAIHLAEAAHGIQDSFVP